MGKPQIALHVHVWVTGVHFKPIKTCLAFTTAYIVVHHEPYCSLTNPLRC